MRRITLFMLAGVLAVAGCGGDDDEPAPTQESGGGGGQALTLTADPGGAISWEPSELSAPAGSVSIELVNESSVPHAVEVEGNGVEEESETVTGANTTLTVDLEAGEYIFYCPVGNHRQQGMEGTLTVE
jgi:plastocyanin